MLVGIAPGIDDFVSGDFSTEHFADGFQQALAHQRVVLRQDLQRDVLVDDLGHQITQLLKLVDVARIHQHAIGQGAGLIPTGLVRLVEQRANLGVTAEQLFVEVSGQRFTAAFQQRDSGFDDGTIRSIQHD